jgi:hypothetical protein
MHQEDAQLGGEKYSPEGYRLFAFESLEDFSIIRIVHLEHNMWYFVEGSVN